MKMTFSYNVNPTVKKMVVTDVESQRQSDIVK